TRRGRAGVSPRAVGTGGEPPTPGGRAAPSVRGGLLVRGAGDIRPGPRRREAALPRPVLERRALPVRRDRRAGTGLAGRSTSRRDGAVLGLGDPDAGRVGGP